MDTRLVNEYLNAIRDLGNTYASLHELNSGYLTIMVISEKFKDLTNSERVNYVFTNVKNNFHNQYMVSFFTLTPNEFLKWELNL